MADRRPVLVDEDAFRRMLGVRDDDPIPDPTAACAVLVTACQIAEAEELHFLLFEQDPPEEGYP